MLTKVADDTFVLTTEQQYELLLAVAETNEMQGPDELKVDYYRNQLGDLIVKADNRAEPIITFLEVAWK